MTPPLPSSSRYSRWLGIVAIEALVLAALVVGVAYGWDEWLEARRGNPPWMVCKVAGWLPWQSIPTVAIGLGITGVMLVFAAQRMLGVALIALALMGYYMPEAFVPSWLSTRCPWLLVGE